MTMRVDILRNERGGGYGSAIGSILGMAAGIVLAPYTGGASLYVTAALSIAGGMVGRVIDNATMGGGGSGPQPQIQDLAIQTSTYGTMIPKLYGKFSVAGNILQATQKVPHFHKSKRGGGSGGFGGPSASSTVVTYTVSLAIGICEGPIQDITRVWADDTIVFPSDTVLPSSGENTYEKFGETLSGVIAYFTLYKGTETQEPDPFFESIVGAGNQPAYRGLAYVVIQHLELGTVGRIPNFRFEVVENNKDDLTAAVTSICLESGLTAGDITVDLGTEPISMLITDIQSAKNIIDQLAEAYGFVGFESESKLKLRLKREENPPNINIPEVVLSGGMDNPDQESLTVLRLQETDLPTKVTVNYASESRNYHAASQIIQLVNSELSDNPVVVGLRLALSEEQARRIAVSSLYEPWTNRELLSGSLPFFYIILDPFDFASLTARGITYLLRIVEMNHGNNWLYTFKALEFDPEISDLGLPPITTLPPPPEAPTLSPAEILILDAPPLSTTDALPRYIAAALPTDPSKSFSRAGLYNSVDNVSYQNVASLNIPAVTGIVASPLPPASTYIWDNVNTLTVILDSPLSTLFSRTDLEVLSGQNLAMYGNECVGFGVATLVGVRTYNLTHLLRGRQGTEGNTSHVSDETFVLLDTTATELGRVAYTTADIGVNEYYKVTDPFTTLVTAVAFQQILSGVSIKPWAPALQTAVCDLPATDDYTFYWYHRSRLADAVWQQGLGITYDPDDTGIYLIKIYTNSSYTTIVRTYSTSAFPAAHDLRSYVYPIADQITDFGSHQTTVYYTIQTVATIQGYNAYGIATCP